jgi:hypothetical protein
VKILLSNDDGYRAEGLIALAAAIRPLGTVTIVAPDRNRSGASNSLTLDVPVRAARYDTDAYYVNGTPTDCVHLAISGLFEFDHDIVVSGVNDGANLGDDTLYSGTVAAAVEGRFLGLPAIAVSLCVEPGSPRNFAAAARASGGGAGATHGGGTIAGAGSRTRHPQRQCSGSSRRRVARAQGDAPRQSAIAASPSSRRRIREAAMFTGWAMPAPVRTPGPVRIFTPWRRATHPLLRCRLT